ncbi:MAG: hypothetical protein GEU86_12635 [Actinophytocola sp.]|nr:hypothetical protein [Actinophytocola sp.]
MTRTGTRPAPSAQVVTPPPARPRPVGMAGPAGRGRRGRMPYLLLAPALLVLLAALGYPLFRQAVMSFQEYGLAQQFGKPPEWVGIDNYEALLTDPYLWTVVARSVVFCLAVVAATMVIGVMLAVLMTLSPKAPRLVLQIGLLVAWAMPHLASLTVWQWLFDSQYGATGWQRFRLITVPLLKPVLLIVGLLQIIWDLKVFTQIFVLQDAGGITRDTNLIGTYIYRLGIGEGQFGLAAAASWR